MNYRLTYRVNLAIAAFFYYSGLIKLLRWWWTQYYRYHLTILNYHSAAGKNLRKQMLYLRRHYRILPLEEALEELYKPDSERKHIRDRRQLISLTFDDGYDDNYTHAFTLASELQVPITIFLIPEYIDEANAFWWVDRLIRHSPVQQVSFEGHTYYLHQQQERKALAHVIDDHVRNATSFAEQEKFLTSICELLVIPFSAMPEEKPAPLLTWTKVREMEESGWISYGAHTVHHPDLQLMTDPAEVEREVGDCRTVLEQQLGHSINTFAYPYGRIGDHGLHAVEQAGYKWALTTVSAINTHQTNPHLLYRKEVDSNMRVVMVAAKVAGVWTFLSHVKRIARLLIRPLHPTSFQSRHSKVLQEERERILV
jgi:peptidoglycan/xylan/chitin deacetylase (PgdA/CDA1 family)